MKQYINLVKDILKNGTVRDDRTGTGTKSVFGRQLRFNLEDGFPACTSKKLAWKAVVAELLWFLEGSSNEHRLAEILRSKPYDEIPLDKRRTIWTDNFNKQGKDLGYENGELGPVYGHQWRHWDYQVETPSRELDENNEPVMYADKGFVDQIQNVIDTIKSNPFSRRILVSAWNVSDLEKMALPPCHLMFQFYVEPDENGKPSKLSLCWTQRSVDVALGLPFNIASYSLLLCLVAEVVGLTPHEVICNLGDTHIYLDHIEPLKQQIQNKLYKLPSLEMPIVKDLNIETIKQLKVDDFVLRDYHCNSSIKMKMSV